MADETGVFRKSEITVLEEVLDATVKSNNGEYLLIQEKLKEIPVGFVIFGKTPCTHFTWDIYWFVVDKDRQGRGIGSDLISKVESYILTSQEKAVLRVETSSREDYFGARRFYVSQGFMKIGVIPDFYAENDSLVIYSKEIKRT